MWNNKHTKINSNHIKNLGNFKAWFIVKTFSCADYANTEYDLESPKIQKQMDLLLPLYLKESKYAKSITRGLKQLPCQIKKVVSFFYPNPDKDFDTNEKTIKESKRGLGQFMTPNFIVKQILNNIKELYPNKKFKTILDPSCGTGNFLSGAINFFDNGSKIIGFDIDPLNLLIAYDQIKSCDKEFELYWIDSIKPKANWLDCVNSKSNNELSLLENLLLKNNCEYFADFLKDNIQQVKKINADLIIGNPPWINFNNLSPIYKESTKPDWIKYDLVSKSGFSLLLGSGKSDLSFLFTHKAIDEYLKNGGVYGLVLPQSAFRAGDAASGFRKFKSLSKKFFFSIQRIDDFDKIKIFEDAQIATCTAIGQKQRKTNYPINYYVWSKKRHKQLKTISDISFIKKFAYPIYDQLKNVFFILSSQKTDNLQTKIYGDNHYVPRQGINTGGANGIFIDKSVSLENFLNSNKFKSEFVEPDLIYPLTTSSDIKKWRVTPSATVLFPYQKDDPKNPITNSDLEKKYPNTLNYLIEHKDHLIKRKSVGFKNKNSFFSFFGVGIYTFLDYKVIWNSLGARKFIAAVAKPVKNRPVIPNQALQTYIATDDINEAFYICGLLNSKLISESIENLGHQGGKSFAQPSQIKKIKLLKWDEKNQVMRKISELAHEAHLKCEDEYYLNQTEEQLEKYVKKLYNSISF